jgi:hypothetical protein
VRLNTEGHAAQPTVISASTELATISAIPAIVPAEFFKPNGADAVLSALKTEVRKVAATLDISTPGGREAIASLAYKVARSKTALDEHGKDLVSAIKKQAGEIDAERKRVRDELDALKDEVRKPLTDWENAEKTRVTAHEGALAAIAESPEFGATESSAELKARLEFLSNFPARDWQEFKARADKALSDEILRTEGLLAHAEKREAAIAELKRLDEEARERAIKEREEAAAKAATEEANRRAAEQARIAREAAERERQRIENERIEAEARVKQAEEQRMAAERKAEQDRIDAERRAEEDRQRAARELKESEERAAQQAEEAEQRRLADIAAAEARRIRDAEHAEAARKDAEKLAEQDRLQAAAKAKRDQEAAVEVERQRVAEEQRKELEEAEKRAKNKAHRLKIDNEVLGAIVALDIPMDRAQDLLIAIAKGAVPHVRIEY